MRRCTGIAEAQRGQSVVETALALPVLVVVLAAAVELVRLFATAAVAQVAASQAARCLAVRPALGGWEPDGLSPALRATLAAHEILSFVRAEPGQVGARFGPVAGAAGVPLARTTVTYHARTWFPFLRTGASARRPDGTPRVPIRMRSAVRIEYAGSGRSVRRSAREAGAED